MSFLNTIPPPPCSKPANSLPYQRDKERSIYQKKKKKSNPPCKDPTKMRGQLISSKYHKRRNKDVRDFIPGLFIMHQLFLRVVIISCITTLSCHRQRHHAYFSVSISNENLNPFPFGSYGQTYITYNFRASELFVKYRWKFFLQGRCRLQERDNINYARTIQRICFLIFSFFLWPHNVR